MLKTFLMMSIIAIFSVIVMWEQGALNHILIALGTVLIVHGTIHSYQKIKGKDYTYETPASSMVAGLIVGLAMPIAAPYYITAIVAFLMILVFKYGQGKFFKRKYLNPAAASKSFLWVLLSLMVFLQDPLLNGLILHEHHAVLNLLTAEGFNDSMYIFDGKVIPFLGIELSAPWGLILWQQHGWIGGASSITVLIVGSIAAYWLRYKWRIIISGLITMTLLSIGIGLIVGPDPFGRIAFHVFTGSFIFMIFFMATEPQSTPMPEISQYIFGISIAVLTFIFQLFNIVGGSIFALIILNFATPLLDKPILRTPFGHRESEGGG
jgi:electron transport complex protein RnfD